MTHPTLYLDLGTEGIRVNFSNSDCAALASTHLCLHEHIECRSTGAITYIQDDSISGLIRDSYPENAVYIEKRDIAGGGKRTLLKMYDRYTIALDSMASDVFVRFPSNVPDSLLVDDVFQAALSPLLMKSGGFILHGSCVVRDNIAIAIMGLSGSGKSTTAFTLTRFGFQCYSDDAVIALPRNRQLYVFPLDRELSVRPLAFRLYQEQNIAMDDYRQDGEKYYFKLKQHRPFGAALKYICFARVSGESKTALEFIRPDAMTRRLLSEQKHFTFINREEAPRFTQVIHETVPYAFSAMVGTDIQMQGSVFSEVINNGSYLADAKCDTPIQNGRSKKKERIKNAWISPEFASIRDIIPMLGDYDMSILKLAHGFFQNFSTAKIEPLVSAVSIQSEPEGFEAGWLRADQWLDGCKDLVKSYRKEVFEKFAESWMMSAPLLYPFLCAATIGQPEKSKIVSDAWKALKQGKPATRDINCRFLKASFIAENEKWQLFSETGTDIRRHELAATRVYCLFDETIALDSATLTSLMEELEPAETIIAVPICPSEPRLISISTEFVRQTIDYGLPARLSRETPFCALSEVDANDLLNSDAFMYADFQSAPGLKYFAVKNTYGSCDTCGLYPLGLCLGAYIKKEIQ